MERNIINETLYTNIYLSGFPFGFYNENNRKKKLQRRRNDDLYICVCEQKKKTYIQ